MGAKIHKILVKVEILTRDEETFSGKVQLLFTKNNKGPFG